MSSFDKVVKLACKPKAAPPKAKYIDPIIAATWSDDGSVHDVCKALAPRIREPNTIVVFKALIVLHTMIRNGATDNVLSYLSSSDVLRLRNVSAGNWEGYAAPQNLQAYALYLDSRIRAYKDLKHDAVRVQAENNRDMRNSVAIEEDGYRGRKDRPTKPNASAPNRSKTIMGRKLRSMTVEKGLLRETKAVHSMIDALVECRFYLDDLEDELTITALRMLVKDLLILFQAGNEGVINVLEHYFEMSHIDAETALQIYRHFCKQTECVVEYLGVAKKLQNLLNVPVPNLKHAPVSLAGALQEYLDDPNFEQNRIEYRANKEAAERGANVTTNGTKATKATSSVSRPAESSTSPKTASASTTNGSASSPSAKQDGKDVHDFFSAIEVEQPTMFNPQTNSTAYFQQQGAVNPFSQMMTGQPFVQSQPNGFIMPQQTAMPQPNPFGNFLTPQVPQQTGHRPFSSYLPPQATGFPSQAQSQAPPIPSLQPPQFLQPQATGANPFRQSMLLPQSTGMQLFGAAPQHPGQGPQHLPGGFPMSTSLSGLSNMVTPSSASPFTAAPKPSFGTSTTTTTTSTPARPASTPLTSTQSALSSSTPQSVRTHQTGTRNPFGPIVIAVPPVPKPPTLFELSNGVGGMSLNQNGSAQQQQQPQQPQQQQQAQQQQPNSTVMGGFPFGNSALNPGATDISSVASSFAFANKASLNKPQGFGNPPQPPAVQPQMTSISSMSGSNFSDSLFSSAAPSQATGTTNTSSPSISFSPAAAPVKPQMTGFAGLKPFKPSSAFGASLVDSLPPIPGSTPTTPAVTGLPSNMNSTTSPNGSTLGAGTTTSSPASPAQNGTSSISNYSFLSSQQTGATGNFGSSFGSTLGVGLRPQMTGGGSNPFRASTIGMPNFGGNSAFQPSTSYGTGASQPFGTTPLGNNAFGTQNQQQQQFKSANPAASLI
ncbi:hypothetical protein NLJ89_g814 [Agrocybe chaxingu]|uniref:ENTH domain-containing protein n=1 Tax=Agrocybe chaxingu TaxID=84603 RepID=A0A9W8TEH9_9AGAR|nr:hypothetical protein NLJ89_g814 [Agrocybe chaxingu]